MFNTMRKILFYLFVRGALYSLWRVVFRLLPLFHKLLKLMNFQPLSRFLVIRLVTLLAAIFLVAGACSVAESKNTSPASTSESKTNSTEPRGATIPIDPNGPADTVREFYRLLREKKFREAIFLTNLRPAIEGLTDTELKEFAVDFEAIAGQVPEVIEINGEIVSGDNATVTANLPNADGDKKEIQQIRLRKENNVWVILSVEGDDEKKIKAEGKQYFYNLRIQNHEADARKIMSDIAKAQFAWATTHNGVYADIPELVEGGLLAEDVKTSASTGYNYSVSLSSDKKKFTASATPAEYGKSGKLSFLMTPDGKRTEKDNGGKPVQK